MSNAVNFEIPATDIVRAQNFYTNVFGWTMSNYPDIDYMILITGPGDVVGMPRKHKFLNDTMMKRTDEIKKPIVTVEVDSIDLTSREIILNGGLILKPKTKVGIMGYSAYFRDCEGNILGLWQSR